MDEHTRNSSDEATRRVRPTPQKGVCIRGCSGTRSGFMKSPISPPVHGLSGHNTQVLLFLPGFLSTALPLLLPTNPKLDGGDLLLHVSAIVSNVAYVDARKEASFSSSWRLERRGLRFFSLSVGCMDGRTGGRNVEGERKLCRPRLFSNSIATRSLRTRHARRMGTGRCRSVQVAS